jgi:hypothetical protein
MLAGIAAHARESVFENSTVEKFLDHLADDLAPVSPAPREAFVVDSAELVEVILDEAVQR